jgi:lysylphosphatidylglycerol synthetase-like protein (DUF2156 family)
MKPDSTNKPAFGLSIATVLVILAAVALHKNYDIHADFLLLLVLLASMLGIVALALTAELIVKSWFKFWSIRFACALAGSAYFFFAKTWAIDDVNSIFGVDASAFPLTLSASVFLNLIYGIRWLFVAVVIFALITFFNNDSEKTKITCLGLA